MRRVAVIGAPASGKTTLARRLGELLGIDVFHLDELYWRNGVRPSPDEWLAFEREIVARPTWIIDGNFSPTLEERLRACDTVVFLDLPTVVCMRRFIWRRFAFRRGGVPGMTPDRRPYVDARVLRAIVAFRRDHRPSFLAALAANAEGRNAVVLHGARDVEQFLERVERVTRRRLAADETASSGPGGAPP